jgi:hypothetical protein
LFLIIETEDRYESDEEFDKVPVNKPKHLLKNSETEIRRIPRETNRSSWFYRTFQRIYNRNRPIVWRFFDDRKSSFGALVNKFIIIIIISFEKEKLIFFF